jgi:hypothetical protein
VDDAELADRLAGETARLAARLWFAIMEHETRGRFALAAAPVAVVFDRPADPALAATHRSGRIAPELLPFLVDATTRTRERLMLADEHDNPQLIALVLACFYVVEGARSGALGLGRVAGRAPSVRVVAPEAATRDLEVRPGTLALRVIAPVESDAGETVTASVELTWS